MTARERLWKRVSDLEAEITRHWKSIHDATDKPWGDINQAHSIARQIIANATAIHKVTAQRREIINTISLLEFHVSKHPTESNTLGI